MRRPPPATDVQPYDLGFRWRHPQPQGPHSIDDESYSLGGGNLHPPPVLLAGHDKSVLRATDDTQACGEFSLQHRVITQVPQEKTQNGSLGHASVYLLPIAPAVTPLGKPPICPAGSPGPPPSYREAPDDVRAPILWVSRTGC